MVGVSALVILPLASWVRASGAWLLDRWVLGRAGRYDIWHWFRYGLSGCLRSRSLLQCSRARASAP